ncbi:MAG: hypothetical protein LBI27_04025 [Clostridiales bacterium]|jgi:hypothetical protein|nr:hypothetical protein [Clostridiales bacterium]
MKKILLFVLITLFAVGCAKDNGEAELHILSIYNIQNDPLAFTGVIKIDGVASSFSESDATFFTVMDTNELLACRNLYCGAYAMPARYSGSDPLPELADMVDITGSFVQTDDGYYFEVTELVVRQNIMHRLTLSNPGGTQ